MAEENWAKRSELHYVYLAYCANGSLYVGYTKNVGQRLAKHNNGQGGRYTQINRPLKLVTFWTFNSKIEALKAERALKRLSPERKLLLAQTKANLNASNLNL